MHIKKTKILFAILTILSVNSSSWGQAINGGASKEISIEFNDSNISTVLSQIEDKTSYIFFYSENWFEGLKGFTTYGKPISVRKIIQVE